MKEIFIKYKKIFIALIVAILAIIGAITLSMINKNTNNSHSINTPIVQHKQVKKQVEHKQVENQKPQMQTVIENNNTSSTGQNINSNSMPVDGQIQQSNTETKYNTKNVVKNPNSTIFYNQNITINNQKNSLTFSITNAKLTQQNQFIFDLNVIKNNNFGGLNVMALDNCGNVLAVNPIGNNGNAIQYEITLLNPKTKCVEISVQSQTDNNIQKTVQIALK